MLPGATAHAPVWLLLPYMAALITGAVRSGACWRGMTRGGDPMRAYIHEQTAQKLPTLARACALFCACWQRQGRGVAVFANGAQMLLGAHGIFILLEIFSLRCFCRRCRVFPGGCRWEKEVIFIQLHMRDLNMRPQLGAWARIFSCLNLQRRTNTAFGQSKKGAFCGRTVPRRESALKFISAISYKRYKNVIYWLTFCQFWGILKTKSLSTSVRCKGTDSTEGLSPFLALRSWGAAGIDLWMRAKYRRFYT